MAHERTYQEAGLFRIESLEFSDVLYVQVVLTQFM